MNEVLEQMTETELRAAIAQGLPCQLGIACDGEALATCIHRPDPELGYIRGNMEPVCVGCHQHTHGNEAIMSDLRLLTRLYYAQQEGRKGIANRIRAYGHMDIPVPMSEVALSEANQLEENLQRYVRQLLKPNGIYNAWLKHIKGIGPMLGASLISEIADISRFPSVRKLWRYAGLHVLEDGKAEKRRGKEKASWNHKLRMTAWKVASQFVRTNPSFGRTLYDDYKAYYQGRDGDLTKGHIDNRARRRVAKDLLRCLWVEWRTLENLPVTEPQAGTSPMPGDWVRGSPPAP